MIQSTARRKCVPLSWGVVAGLIIAPYLVHVIIALPTVAEPGSPWSAAVRVSDDTRTRAFSHSIAVDAQGNAYVMWGGDDGDPTLVYPDYSQEDIYVTYRPVGGSWMSARLVHEPDERADQRGGVIAVDGQGNAYAIWEDWRHDKTGHSYVMQPGFKPRRRDGNPAIYFAICPTDGEWGISQRVDDAQEPHDVYQPDLAVDRDGNAYAVWKDARLGNYDIFFAYRPAGGTWGVNQCVNDDLGSADQTSPAVAIDTHGNAYVVWMDYRHGDNQPGIYFAHRAADGTWSPNEQVNEPSMRVGIGDPDISVDAFGNAYVLWSGTSDLFGDVYFSYRPIEGPWSTSIRVNDEPTEQSDYRSCAITVDPLGNVYAVWEGHNRQGADGYHNYDVYFSCRPVGRQWSPSERVNEVVEGKNYFVSDLAVDEIGNAYVVWDDDHMGELAVYFSYRPAMSASTPTPIPSTPTATPGTLSTSSPVPTAMPAFPSGQPRGSGPGCWPPLVASAAAMLAVVMWRRCRLW